MVKLATGQIPNFFSVDKVQSFVKNFARLNSHTNSVGNHYHGIGPDHLGYLFVKKQLLNPILDYFNITAELVFAFYLDCVAPIGPHCDMHQLPGPGEHWRSFLIPYSVDNQTSLCGYASTAVLHQWGYSAIEDLPDLDTNLLPYQALDAEAELTSIMSEYISLEIDLEVLDMLIQDASAADEWWSAVNNRALNSAKTGYDNLGFYNTQGQWFQTFAWNFLLILSEV